MVSWRPAHTYPEALASEIMSLSFRWVGSPVEPQWRDLLMLFAFPCHVLSDQVNPSGLPPDLKNKGPRWRIHTMHPVIDALTVDTHATLFDDARRGRR